MYRGGTVDDRTTAHETTPTGGDRKTVDAAVSPAQTIPDDRPPQVRPQVPGEPVHVIDPGDIGGAGQHLVADPPSERERH